MPPGAYHPPFGSPHGDGALIPSWNLNRIVTLYTQAGTDATAGTTTPETSALFTAATAESIVTIYFVNGSTPIVADDANFAELDVNLYDSSNTQLDSFPWTTQTSALSGMGNLAANTTIDLSTFGFGPGNFPYALPSGGYIKIAVQKFGTGIRLGPWTLTAKVIP